MKQQRPISVMVNVLGQVDNSGKMRQSMHLFEFISEAEVDAWLESAPVKQIMYDDGPVVHVEMPKTNGLE